MKKIILMLLSVFILTGCFNEFLNDNNFAIGKNVESYRVEIKEDDSIVIVDNYNNEQYKIISSDNVLYIFDDYMYVEKEEAGKTTYEKSELIAEFKVDKLKDGLMNIVEKEKVTDTDEKVYNVTFNEYFSEKMFGESEEQLKGKIYLKNNYVYKIVYYLEDGDLECTFSKINEITKYNEKKIDEASTLVENEIESANKRVAELNALGFAKAAQNYWFENEFAMLKDPTLKQLTEANVEDISTSGATPTGCKKVYFDKNGKVSYTGCIFSGYKFNYSNNEVKFVEKVESEDNDIEKTESYRSASGFAYAAKNYWFENAFDGNKITEAKVENIEVGGVSPTGCKKVYFDNDGRVSFSGCIFSNVKYDCKNDYISLSK